MLKVRRTVSERLREAIGELAEGHAQILTHAVTAWASATFTGTRHRLALVFEGAEAVAAGENFIALLSEHEFEVPGQLVAEAAVVYVDHRLLPELRLALTAELLLLDEG